MSNFLFSLLFDKILLIFKECESACRNDKEAMICTLQCVLVCNFGGEEISKEIKLDTRNTSYLIDEEKIVLENDHSETEIFPGAASKNITNIFSANTKKDFDGRFSSNPKIHRDG